MKEQVSVDDVLISIRKMWRDEMPEKTAAWQAFLQTMGNRMLTVNSGGKLKSYKITYVRSGK